MFDSFVKLGEPVWLSEKKEIIVSETIAEIAEKDELNILAYNICGDHAHILLVCEEEELPKIVQKIKSMSARACNIAMGRTIPTAMEHAPSQMHTPSSGISSSGTGTREQAPLSGEPDAWQTGEHAPRETRGKTQFHLWTQKFGNTPITSTEQLENTIRYIENNRIKHGLDDQNKGACSLAEIAKRITCTREHAFRTEYKGGFDVVIGNPPYVHLEKIKDTSVALKNAGYKTYHSQGDIYCVFVEKGIELLKSNGLISYIVPNKWLQAGYGKPLREYLLKLGYAHATYS
jgi:REP element-mobilizing transposase RayT